MKRLIQHKIGLLIIPASLFVSGAALAQSGECSEDADCAEGQTCEKGMFVPGCDVGPNGDTSDCSSEPQEAETGYCVTPPTPCETDGDCGEYLSCVSQAAGDCAVDSEGNTTCSEPDADAPKYCSVAALPCEADDECPRDFECVEVAVCLAITCIEGDAECLDACESNGQKECQPKQIACEETADCPSAWSCIGNYIETCEGETSVDPPEGSGEGSTEGSEDPAAPDEVVCTTEPTVGSCYPDAWGGNGLIYATDILEPGAEDDGAGSTADPTSGDSEGVSAGGGCSVAQVPGRFDASWALALLLALPLARRRRSLA